jgi:hypothetical protein
MSFSMKDLMSDQPQSQATTPAQPQQQPTAVISATPASPSDGSFSMAELTKDDEQNQQTTQAKPVRTPEEQASQNLQSMVSGLTGMPTPNMSAGDRAQFERGKAAGAVSVPLVAGAATGATAIAEALPSVLIHTVEGVKALGVWAEAHPYKAFMLYQVAKELLPGAKKMLGFVKAAPTVE